MLLFFFCLFIYFIYLLGLCRYDGAVDPVWSCGRAGLPAEEQPGVPLQQEHLVHARHVLCPLHDQVRGVPAVFRIHIHFILIQLKS